MDKQQAAEEAKRLWPLPENHTEEQADQMELYWGIFSAGADWYSLKSASQPVDKNFHVRLKANIERLLRESKVIDHFVSEYTPQPLQDFMKSLDTLQLSDINKHPGMAQQSPTDAVDFTEWRNKIGFELHKNGFWYKNSEPLKCTTAELYNLFNPSGNAAEKIKCTCHSDSEHENCTADCDWYNARINKPGNTLVDYENEPADRQMQTAGPVWVNCAKQRPIKWEEKIIRQVGDKVALDNSLFDADYDGSGLRKIGGTGFQPWKNLEWLDESGGEVFTREQVEEITGEWTAELTSSGFPLRQITQLSNRFSEWFNENFPPKELTNAPTK